MQIVNLGRTGLRVSRLSIGTGTVGNGGSSNQTRLGLKELANLLCFAYRQGVTFWDAADEYGSHPHIKEALKYVDRSEIVITTKTTSRSAKSVEDDVKRFLREIASDYVDIVLLHCLTQSDWTSRYPDAMEALSRCKEKGLIRAHGVSCHDYGAFQTAAMTTWVEVVLARINYAGVSMDASPVDVIRTMEHMASVGQGIYGMKVFGQGKLAKYDGPKKGIEFVMGLPCVNAMTIGMESEQEIEENVAIVKQLTVSQSENN